MKIHYLLLWFFSLFIGNLLEGQTIWQQNGSSIYYNSGSVGIGTSTPSQDLEIDGNLYTHDDLQSNDFHTRYLGNVGGNNSYVLLLFEKGGGNQNFVSGKIIGRRGTGQLNSHEVNVYANQGSTNFIRGYLNYRALQSTFTVTLVSCDYNGKSYIAVRFNGTQDHRHGVYFSGQILSTDPSNMLQTIYESSSLLSNIVTLSNGNTSEINNAAEYVFNGKIGIGTNTPQSELAVNGEIRANKVRAMNDIQGADFVFEPDYKLPTLSAVEKYIKEHRHLPEIPSAKEMQEQGLDLAEINIKLLQKVEELTLYLIEQQKQIGTLEQSLLEIKKSK